MANLSDFIGNVINSVKEKAASAIAEGGLAANSQRADGSLDATYNAPSEDVYPSYGYDYGYGYGGGGGSGGMSDEERHARTQAQINNTAANYQRRGNDITSNTYSRRRDFSDLATDRAKEMSDSAKMILEDVGNQRAENKATYRQNVKRVNSQVKWQPAEQKKQSMVAAMRDRMGNAAWGSAIQDLAESLRRYDDMSDVELIDAWKQNMDTAYGNYVQTDSQLASTYNDEVADILDKFSEFKADYDNEVSEMRAKYNDTMSDLRSQYAAAISNIDSMLGSYENLDKSTARGGYGDEQYDISNPNLASDADWAGLPGKVEPSDDLRKMLVRQELLDVVNPLTKEYIRPDKSRGNGVHNAKSTNASRAANSAFADNLAAFRRV